MFRIPNWRAFQGYQKRGPPWVKLHVGLLRHKFWPRLSMRARAALPALWIVASEQSQDGSMDDDIESLAHLVSMSNFELSAAIVELKSFGFIDSDKSVAELATEVSHQTERETEGEGEREPDMGVRARDLPRTPGTTTALSKAECDVQDRIDEQIAFDEKRFTRLAVEIRASGHDIQKVLDGLKRPSNQPAFSASRWLATGLTGIGRSEKAMTLLKLTCDGLEEFQRAQATPILSDNNRQALSAIERVAARMIAQRDGIPVPKELAK